MTEKVSFKKTKGYKIFRYCLLAVAVCYVGLGEVHRSTMTITVSAKSEYHGRHSHYGKINATTAAGEKIELENRETWLHQKYEYGSLQKRLKVGATYKVSTVGFLLPQVGLEPNILTAKLVE